MLRRGAKLAVGIVLITTEPGKERKVYQELKNMRDVKDLTLLLGKYDVCAKVEARSYDDLSEIIVNQIRQIEGVTDTATLIGVEL
jgi:DNA-binding Lrp family transcriptional regulator